MFSKGFGPFRLITRNSLCRSDWLRACGVNCLFKSWCVLSSRNVRMSRAQLFACVRRASARTLPLSCIPCFDWYREWLRCCSSHGWLVNKKNVLQPAEVAGTKRYKLRHLIPFVLYVCMRMTEDLLEVAQKKSVGTASGDSVGTALERGLRRFAIRYVCRVKSLGAGLGAGV